MIETDDYMQAFKGYFLGMKRWDDLSDLWLKLHNNNQGQWYIYATELSPPNEASSISELEDFIKTADKYLRENHEEDYCGIVYVDDAKEPRFIKIYDPNNLGVVCGFSDNPPLPKWVLSHIKPININVTPPSPWKKFLHRFT